MEYFVTIKMMIKKNVYDIKMESGLQISIYNWIYVYISIYTVYSRPLNILELF